MSLQKIGKYTEILESSRSLRKPTEIDNLRVSLITNIAIAGLIEAGAPFQSEGGTITVDTGMEDITVNITDVYPYLSEEGKMKVIVTNAKHAELPAPNMTYEAPQQTAAPQTPEYTRYEQPAQTEPENVGEYQTQASYEQEKHNDVAGSMMNGLEDYNITPEEEKEVLDHQAEMDEIDKLYDQALRQKKLENEKWENVDAQAPEIKENITPEPIPEPVQAPVEPQMVQQSDESIPKPAYVPPVQETIQPINQPVTPQVQAPIQTQMANPTQTPVQPTQPVYEADNPTDVLTTDVDVTSINKDNLIYERCRLELQNIITGETYRFTVHGCPLTEKNDGKIIVRVKQVGKDAKFIKTQQGTSVTFDFNGLQIHASRNQTADGSFSIQYWIDTNEYVLSKIDAEYGGNGSNLVIYDDNIEIRIYPVPNVRDNNTGKMLFGNNNRGEAAYLYYIKNGNEEIASSGVERAPKFDYEGSKFVIKARWDNEMINFAAEEDR